MIFGARKPIPMPRFFLTLPVLLLAILLVGCQSEDPNDDYLITIHTAKGDMKVILFEETPLHKANFVELAKSGRYDSTLWHRVIEDFMIQGGDVYKKEDKEEPESKRVPAEFVKGIYHTKGALAAARQGDKYNPEKKSSSCQFYIVQGIGYEQLNTDLYTLNAKMGELIRMEKYADLATKFQSLAVAQDTRGMNQLAFENKELVEKEFGISLSKPVVKDEAKEAYKDSGGTPFLDGEYTVFGKVVEGLEVIDAIAGVTTLPGDRPAQNLYLTMEVKRIPKTEITKKYGYEYPEEK